MTATDDRDRDEPTDRRPSPRETVSIKARQQDNRFQELEEIERRIERLRRLWPEDEDPGITENLSTAEEWIRSARDLRARRLEVEVSQLLDEVDPEEVLEEIEGRASVAPDGEVVDHDPAIIGVDRWKDELLDDDPELRADGGSRVSENESEESIDHRPRHVVIVPEDPADRPSIEEIQERFGVESNGAPDGELPEIDGEALVQELAELEAGQRLATDGSRPERLARAEEEAIELLEQDLPILNAVEIVADRLGLERRQRETLRDRIIDRDEESSLREDLE